MSEDHFSLDSLLEDLDAAVRSPAAAPQSTSTTMKFVPHPPAKDKQTSHTTTFNPKNRFAVQPSSSASVSPEAGNDPSYANKTAPRFAYGSPEKPFSAHGSSSISNSNSQNKPFRSDPDENSIDNLLNLISSPSASAQKLAVSNNGAFSYSQSASSGSGLNSQFFLDSQKVNSGAGHSGRFPTMNTDQSHSYNSNSSATTSSVYTPQVIAADSNLSSPFDSPNSHHSAHKTHNTLSTHSTHSTSMYNMSTHNTLANNANNSFQPNLASSFDSAESNSDRVPALFNTNTTTPNTNTNATNSIGGYNNTNTVMYGSSSSSSNCSNSQLQPIRSGTGVSGGLFGGTNINTNTSTNTTTYNNSNAYNNTTSNTSTTNTSYANAVSPKGNTATFTSQNGSLRAQNESKQAQNAHFLPTSINATTVVSNSSVGSGASSSGAGASSGGAKQKCSRVVIGGVNIPRGRKTSAFANFACNNLRCLQCNFKVHCFSNSEWDASVDYMFLRNTVPNEQKLAVKLTRSAEKCAYCCQCSSASEGGERELNATLSTQGPQWVCAGH